MEGYYIKVHISIYLEGYGIMVDENRIEGYIVISVYISRVIQVLGRVIKV